MKALLPQSGLQGQRISTPKAEGMLDLLRLLPIAVAIWIIGGAFAYYFVGGDGAMGLTAGTGVFNYFYVLAGVTFPLVVYLGLHIRRVLALIESNPFVLLFLLYIALSNLWASDPLAAKDVTEQYFVSYIVACFCSIAMKPAQIVKMIFIIGLLSVFLSIVWVVLHHDLAVYNGSIFPGQWRGVYVHKNRLGQIVGIFLPLAVIWSGKVFPAKLRFPLTVLTLAASLLVLVKAGSASALMISFCGLTVWYVSKGMRRANRVNRLILALGACLIVPLVLLYGPELALTVLGRDATLTGRTDIWAVLLNKFFQGNVWLGSGVGETYSSRQRALMEAALGYAFDAHNGYLTFLVELGYIGLVLILTAIALAIYRGYSSVSPAGKDGDVKYVFITLIFSWLASMCVESGPAVGSNTLMIIGLISVVALTTPKSWNRQSVNTDKTVSRIRANALVRGLTPDRR